MYKFNRSAAPFRIIFSRAYVFTVCSPLLALVRCNLPRSRSVRIQHLSRLPRTVRRKSRRLTLRSTCLCLFRRGVPRATYGIETVPALFGGKRVLCPKVVKRKFVAHVVTCRKTFGEDRGKEPFGTFSLVYRQFVFILTNIQQPPVGRLVR